MNEIKIDSYVLLKCEEQLNYLVNNISTRKLKVEFVHAKGAVVDNLLLTAEQLKIIESEIKEFIYRTEQAVREIRNSFEEMDDKCAQEISNITGDDK